jgi:ABC-2 type transport system permease protein
MGFEGINMLMLLIITLVSSLIGIVFGFAIGFISSNQFNGITNMKIGLLILMIPTILAFFLPKGAQIFLYWAPTYWSAMALKDLVNVQQRWGNMFVQISGIILTLAIFILILTPRFKKTLKL